MVGGQATVEERQLLKTLRWWDGFLVALANPGFLIASFGFSVGVLGPWGAAMFPHKSGGIALYAHEGWKRYSSLVGPVSTFGYWFGWSAVLSIFGLIIGNLAQAQWFSSSTWSVNLGLSHFGLPKLIAVLCIIAIFVFNYRGMRPAVWVSYATGALL